MGMDPARLDPDGEQEGRAGALYQRLIRSCKVGKWPWQLLRHPITQLCLLDSVEVQEEGTVHPFYVHVLVEMSHCPFLLLWWSWGPVLVVLWDLLCSC